jgi:uncharacterized protein (DUF2236 family)
MMDSAQCLYELVVRRLSPPEREALWQDYLRFAALFGMPLDDAPGTYPEFREYWRAQLASDDLFLTDEARYVGYITAFEIPLPRTHQPGKRIHDLLMLGSLPKRVRDLYGLSYTPAQATAYAAAVGAVRAARRITPRAVAKGWNTRAFGVVEQTERWRIDRGRPTPQVTEAGPVPIGRGPAASPAAGSSQETSSTTLPVAPRSSSSASASPARSNG